MHPSSFSIMQEMLARHPASGLVYDVGSFNINGTYRSLIDCRYVGLDIRAGRNVDIVIPENKDWNLPPGDMAISGQCLEHVKRPWQWIKQVAAILKPGAKFLVVVPWKWPKHGVVDCWRVFPDGLKSLLELGNFAVLEVGRTENDTFGAAQFRGNS